MHVEVKSSSGITLVPLETRNLARRIVSLRGEINEESACSFAEQVLYLNAEDDTLPITVLIHSPGGGIKDGLLIYDVICASKAPVRLVCVGHAYSMAAVILACGSHGRYILPHSETMLHEPLLSRGVSGSCSSIRSISESMMESRRILNELLVKHTGRSMEEVEAATAFDNYMTAEESVKFGLCDRIIEFSEILGGVQ